MKIEGIITAVITPFSDGKLDLESFTRVLEFLIQEGSDGLVINGTTGESPTLETKEVEILCKRAREIAGVPTRALCQRGQ